MDAVLVGGADALCQMTVRGFHSLGALSAGPCKPFASQASGINIGEGAAFFLVEREGTARLRLLGVGESGDAHHMTAPHPEGEGAIRAMASALAASGASPDAIDWGQLGIDLVVDCSGSMRGMPLETAKADAKG